MKKNKSMVKATVLAIVLVLGLAITSVFAVTKAEKLIEEGHRAYRNMEFKKAAVLYEKALESDPANLTALKYCGFANQRAGNTEAAIKCLEELYAVTMDEAVLDRITAMQSGATPGNRGKEEKNEGEEKIYRHLISSNVIPFIALFLNLSYEFAIGDYLGIRLGGYTWTYFASDFSGLFAQAHFYPQGRGLSGWLIGGGLGTIGTGETFLLPNAQGGYRWISEEGFSIDIMMGAIYTGFLFGNASYFGDAYTWPTVEINVGYAF